MPEDSTTPTPLRIRRHGQRMNAKERKTVQEKFLQSFSRTANIRAACLAAHIDRSTVYYWQEHDTEFSLKFNVANEEANDLIRAALWRRGVEGVETYVISMGKAVYVDGKPLMEREYSDNLLALLAKARMPEFRDKGIIINNVLPKEYHNVPEDGIERE
jgi:hypothetical protein